MLIPYIPKKDAYNVTKFPHDRKVKKLYRKNVGNHAPVLWITELSNQAWWHTLVTLGKDRRLRSYSYRHGEDSLSYEGPCL